MSNYPKGTIYLKDYTPPDYLIHTVDLHVALNDDVTTVKSSLSIELNDARVHSQMPPLMLDGKELDLKSVVLDGKNLSSDEYEVTAEHLILHPQTPTFSLVIETAIKPQDNTSLEGLYQSNGNYCTQCEAHGFRKITYFLDRPDVMASFTTTIEANQDHYPTLLSNGNLVDSGELSNRRHFVKWVDPFKKPCYLFALVAGDLVAVEDKFITRSNREVVLKIFVEQGNQNRCAHAMRALKNAMLWDEEHYGREYDLDIFMIVAVSYFNMGAMENKGLNIFNAKYILAEPETATDADYQAIETVIGHEYFHNWTGNRITCRDWFQLSLKEGLTVFRDQSFTADRYSHAAVRIEDVRLLRATQFPEDAGPLAHPVRPASYLEMNNFYTATVYNKGAEVIRMLQTLLTPSGFRRGMDLYFERHDGQAVTCDDFVQAMQDASGIDLTQFKRWYSQAGTPRLTVRTAYDATQKTYTLTVEQQTPPTPDQLEKQALHIPLSVGLLDQQGQEMRLQLQGDSDDVQTKSRVLSITQPKETFTFLNVQESPVPSLLRGFSAPVKLDAGYSQEELVFLLSYDSDEFNRWEAGQQLASNILLQLVRDYREGRELILNEVFLKAIEMVLKSNKLDQAVQASILMMPSEVYIGEQMAVIDVEGIYHARRFLRRELARRLQALFLSLYEANDEKEQAYSVNEKTFARRKLKNVCLSYLALLEDTDSRARCLQQFKAANNMTDSMTALQALSHTDCVERTQALDLFYHRWQSDPLTLDKWFAVQAASELPDTLKQVKTLMQLPTFTLLNPNRVRALIGTFTTNFIHFHDISGQGYAFLAEQVLQLNTTNPQIAARLVQALTPWKRYDQERQGLMSAQLERIKQAASLSKNVYEIVSKSL